MHATVKLVAILGLFTSACDLGYTIGTWPDAGPDAATSDAQAGASDGITACPSQTVTVSIRAMSFSPKALSIAPGTRVTWWNQDSTNHDVTEGDPGNPAPGFESGSMFPGDTWSFDFCAPGVTIVYHCAAHPAHMRDATVTVTR